MDKPKCMITVDVEALQRRAPYDHVDRLIWGRVDGQEYGIGKIMDIADKHHVKITFFVDFAECETYGEEKIFEIARYIVSRGHDMQVHCHWEQMGRIVGKSAKDSGYLSWFQNETDAGKVIAYLTEKYMACTGKMPVAYRGGAYRFDIPVLKALKEHGYQADLSYNCNRPKFLAGERQFRYENGLLELPVSVLPDIELNFTGSRFTPKDKADYESSLGEYRRCFDGFYEYYGQDAVATLMMHSWAFLRDAEHEAETGYLDKPNGLMAEFFDSFLEQMKERLNFITVSEAVADMEGRSLKQMDFDALFKANDSLSEEELLRKADYINRKAGGRRVVVWGKGVIETTAFTTVDLHQHLHTAFYLSRDADSVPQWRGKPVYKASDVTLNPQTDYVLVTAKPFFSDIRDSLQALGFQKHEDYFEILEGVPKETENGVRTELDFACPVCGGHIFDTFNSNKPRRCIGCGAVDRNRTMALLFRDNVQLDPAKEKILHVSPGRSEKKVFRSISSGEPDITTIDIRPELKTDLIGDVCNMPEVASDSYDAVFACCVLNHVYDDEKALGEFHRVLRKGGKAILYVMGSGNHNTYEDDPTGWYGRENFEKYKIGTFRLYGEVDFTNQLRSHFRDVCCYEKYDAVTNTACKWYVCIK